MKKTKFAEDVKSWLDFAEYDLKSARWQYEGEIYTSSCYVAQQVAEKAFKALILANGKLVPKIHSLDRLLSFLRELKVDSKEIEEESRELDKYYIATRYPGQYGGLEGLYDKSDAESAISSAEKILNFVKKQVPVLKTS